MSQEKQYFIMIQMMGNNVIKVKNTKKLVESAEVVTARVVKLLEKVKVVGHI